MRQFGRLLAAALTDVRVEWGGLEVTPASTVVPPVFAGGRLVLYGLVNEVKRTTVRLTAQAPSGSLAFDVAVDPARATVGRTVATLAARARIRELEECPEWVLRGSLQRERKERAASREIIELSVHYGLISRETSFVAVERRDRPVEGSVQLRRVPIALTTGWGDLLIAGRGHAHLAALALDATAFFAAPAALREEPDGMGPPTADIGGRVGQVLSHLVDWRRGSAYAGAPATRPLQHGARTGSAGSVELRSRVEDAGTTAMRTLIVLQRADGSWDLTRDFASAIGCNLADLEAELTAVSGDREESRRAWATALALAWLQDHASACIDEWRLLGQKARSWLARVAGVPANGATWIDTANRFLRP
jgi:hypothetical protein